VAHLSGDVEAFVRGTLSCPARRRVLAHLLHGCPECGAALARYAGFEINPGARPNPDAYDSSFQLALTKARQIAHSRNEGIAALEALLRLDEATTSIAAARARDCRGIQQVASLLQAAHSYRRHSDPGPMVEFAYLACRAAGSLQETIYGAYAVSDLRGLAWAELGNAYRVGADFDQAERALDTAVYWVRRGSQNPRLLARLGVLVASLLIDLRRFIPARELLSQAHDTYTAAGDLHLAGRTLVTAGHLAHTMATPDAFRDAIRLYARALDLLDHERDPQLIAQALHGMIYSLVNLGQARVARIQLWRLRPLLATYGGRSDLLRVRWLEAKIYAGLGDFERAEAAFQEARSGFAAAGQIFPAALASLELAALWADRGRTREIGLIAGELIGNFRALGIAREAIATLIILQRACDFGGRVTDLIEAASAVLRELQRRPTRPLPSLLA
jgi:tetratricopeptide (TPR) repeat protein